MNAKKSIWAMAVLATIAGQAELPAQEARIVQSLSLDTAMEAASRHAEEVLAAQRAYEDAATALSDAAPWKAIRLSGDASWTGDLSPEPGPASGQSPSSYSASLNLPLLDSLSLSAGARLGGDLSASFSWQPLSFTQGVAELELKLYKAGTALAQARNQARLDAMAAFMDVLSAEAELNAAERGFSKAQLSLSEARSSFERGELSQAALARVQAAVPKAQASMDRARYQVRKARLGLGKLLGQSLAAALEGGTALDSQAALVALDPGWEAPPASEDGKAVLDARASLEYARKTPLFSGSGPVSVKGSLSSNGSFSLGVSIALDWKLVSGRDFQDRSLAVAKAEEALADALEAQDEARAAAVLDELVARLSLAECESALEAARLDLAQAQVLDRLGELSASELADYENALAKAELNLDLARIGLAKARLSLSS